LSTAVDPTISFTGVSRSFASADGLEVQALRDVTFDIARHEFVSVIGPSGCGKSTAIKLVAGLLPPSAGTVSVSGAAVTGPLDQIGIVFQKPTLLPWLDIVGNVVFPMRHKYGRVTKADTERAEGLLELVGLAEFRHKQRAAIARALLLDPDILLMDEPFSALDALTRDEMSFELLRIWKDNPKTVLFITHSIAEALLLSDRIVVMTPRPATIREIIAVPFSRPRTIETLSDPAFNELAGHIRATVFSRHGNAQPASNA
jgi:NitT/TauT family transport system ATP-binding protein